MLEKLALSTGRPFGSLDEACDPNLAIKLEIVYKLFHWNKMDNNVW